MRRGSLWATIAIVAVASLLAVVGCGGDDDEGSGEKGSKEPVTLTWWDYYGDLEETNNLLNKAARQYEKEHPNVTIKRTTFGFADLKPKIIQAAATNELPDILIVDNPDHQSLADQGALADLTDKVSDWEDRDAYFDGPWQSTQYEDKNYGVPFESNATGLFYNRDLFRTAGIKDPPKTWEELRTTARGLTDGRTAGFCFSANADEEGTFTFLPFLWQAGGDVQTIGDEPSIKALTFWDQLVNQDGSAPSQVVSWGQGDVFNRFIAGRCAMMINGPWQLDPLETDPPGFGWGVAPWPSDAESASILGGENWAVGANQDVDAAWEVIDWMSDPDHVRAPLRSVGLPNREDMADDEAWSDPQTSVFVDQVEIARPRAYGARYPEISEEINRMYQQVLTGEATPNEAAKQASEAIGPLLPSS